MRVPYAFHFCKSSTRSAPVVGWSRSREHRVDRRRHELNVAELFRGNAGEQVIERPSSLPGPEVERLEGVVEPGRHLAELAAEQLLDGCGTLRVRIGRRW